MSIFKVAYARGVQHALVAARAIGKYASEEQADAAAAQAAEEIPANLPVEGQAVPQDVTGDVAAKLVELSQAAGQTAAAAAEQSNIAQEAAQAVQALQGGAPGAAPSAPPGTPPEQDPAALSAAAGQLEQKAAALRVMQKRAALRLRKLAEGTDLTGAAVGTGTGIDALANLTAENALEASKRPGSYANTPPAQQMASSAFIGMEEPHPGAPTLADAFADRSGEGKAASVRIDAKTAAAILRKLAEGGDMSSDLTGGGSEMGTGINALGALTQENEEERKKREGSYANNPPAPTAPEAQLFVEGTHPGAQTDAKVAFDMLFRKTAAEVGRYIPSNIPETAKVAAVRTMIGMNNQERGSYLQRLHKAAEDAAPEENKEEVTCGNEKCEKDGKCSCEEKSAAMLLRRLGLGR